MNINIDITGMGSIITFESLLIERMFKELGYIVEVDNDIPHANKEAEDEYIDWCKKLNHTEKTIKLKVNHCQWGG
jgi:hypothetical protein